MPGTTVTVANVATGLSRTNVTSAEGRYVIAGLPPGDYELRPSAWLQTAPTSIDTRRSRDRHPQHCPGVVRSPGNCEHRRINAGGQHVELRAELSGRLERDRRAAAERPQLHRPRAAATGRAGLPASRRRLGGGARTRHERQRTGPALERLPARRHAAERFHQRTGGQRRGHGARHRDDPRIPGRDQRLQRRVRPQLGRPDQRADQVGRQRSSRHASTSSTATTRSTRATTSTPAGNPTSSATSSAARSAGRSPRDRRSFSSATRL